MRLVKLSYIFILLTVISDLRGNISRSFRDSLSYQNSQNYVWSLWDYLSNPYLYSLNKKNSMSFALTNLENVSVGGSYILYGRPYYIISEIGNKNATEFNRNVPNRDIRFVSPTDKISSGNDVTNLHLMLGSIVFANYGLGIYGRYGKNTEKKSDENISARGQDSLYIVEQEPTTQGNKDNTSYLSLGFEFGEYSPSPGSFSFSVGLGYNLYGSERQEVDQETGILVGRNNAPFLELGTDIQAYTFVTSSGDRFLGSKKREFALNFLGWYRLNSFLNTGMYLDAFYQPRLVGVDSSVITRDTFFTPNADQVLVSEGAKVGVAAMKVSLESFLDIDSTTERGVFRITPSFRFSYHQESAEFNEFLKNGSIENKEIFFDVGFAFRMQFDLNESKTFSLVAGWHPKLNLSYKLTQKIKSLETQVETSNTKIIVVEDTDNGELKLERTRGLFTTTTNDGETLTQISLGFIYRLDDHITFHIGSAVQDGEFNIDRLSFGLDYYFPTSEKK